MSFLAANSRIFCSEVYQREHQQQFWSASKGSFALPKSPGFGFLHRNRKILRRRDLKVEAFWPESKPTFVEMESINDSDHLDHILTQAQQLAQPIVIDWMAVRCRKCIYLKPKLEKLAAEYETKVKFYYVDVNKVPQTLVKRGNISKMPTIQIHVSNHAKRGVDYMNEGTVRVKNKKRKLTAFILSLLKKKNSV